MFAADGALHLAPFGSWQELHEHWRQTIVQRFLAAGGLAPWQVARLNEWRHSATGRTRVRDIFAKFRWYISAPVTPMLPTRSGNVHDWPA
ncbi:MAG: hypothetical protein HY736_07350 [Verrucomicrobia bacterium]|nr:hypothetical protein [Verrucomicrobiota bacterium]